MRNSYPAMCYRCGQLVAAGEGHFERSNAQRAGVPKWRVQHSTCAIKHRGTEHAHNPAEQIAVRREQDSRRLVRLQMTALDHTGKSAQRARQELRALGLWGKDGSLA